MARIGVLTFHNGPNFGGVLQAWHMVHAIRGLGHECHAVNYLHASHYEPMQRRIPVNSLNSLRARAHWELKKYGFRGFSDSICRHPFTCHAEQVPWDDFDGFCVGSDVVWEYQSMGYGRDPVYLGEAPGMIGKPIMSYAASCGPASPDGPLPDYIKSGLKRFSAIGVRDSATASLVRNATGRDSKMVVDPTWLGADPEPLGKHPSRRKYLFVYGSRRLDGATAERIRKYCRDRGLALVSALTPFKKADKMYRTITPFRWVQLFKEAECVVVLGSLHGVAYSIKYGKPFIMIPNLGSTQKISTMLERTGQSHRMLDVKDITARSMLLLEENQSDLPMIPESWRQESLGFLRDSIAGMIKHSPT